MKHLSVAWIYDLPAGSPSVKATPLQVNGVLYFTTPDHVYAVEARTGRELWHYVWTRNRGGNKIGNRGVGILGDSLFFVTPDCNLVSLDIKTGRENWFKEYCSLEMMYYGSVAPVIVKDRVIVGVSGDDLDQPAYLDARNPANGDLIWRWYVTPQAKDDPGLDTWPNLDMAKHGGGMTWQPVTYDPELNLDLRHHRQSAAGRGLRQSHRREPVYGLDRRAQCRHRKDGVVLPIVAARHARLGCDPDARALR